MSEIVKSNIAEMFGPVIQGEGATMGVPSFFLRYSQCSLMCGGHNGSLLAAGKATWWCDSEVIWKKGVDKHPQEILDFMAEQGELERILAGTTHVILTGGEPALPQNLKAITSLIDYIRENYPDSTPYYELETSASRYHPTNDKWFDEYIDQINCSAKIANSGMPKAMRVQPRALRQMTAHKNFWWKIVVSSEDDWNEFMNDYGEFVDLNRVYVMPAGATKADLLKTNKVAWDLACKYNVRMSLRAQVETWEEVTGV